VSYGESLGMSGMPDSPMESRQTRLGFLPVSAAGRTYRFDNASEVIGALRPGETATLAVTETVAFDGGGSAQSVATVTFVGCGTSGPAVTGASGARVRVYRLTMPYTVPGADAPLSKATNIEYVLSEAEGWPVAERSASGTMVLISTSD